MRVLRRPRLADLPNTGFSDDELLALPRYRQSDLFTEREKLALDYTVAVMRTPVEVTDELFAQMKEHFSDEQRVELTALLTVVNLDRFNAAFGIGSAGLSEGMVCVPPPRTAPPPTRRWQNRLETGRGTRAVHGASGSEDALAGALEVTAFHWSYLQSAERAFAGATIKY